MAVDSVTTPCTHRGLSMFDMNMARRYECPDCGAVLKNNRGGALPAEQVEEPRTLEDIRWARRMGATRVLEAAARVRVEHGRVVDIYDLVEALDAYLEGERTGWAGQRKPKDER